LSLVFCKRGVAAAAFCLLAACGQSGPRATRMAVLRFENLTGDPALDWMGRGLSEAVSGSLAGSPRVYPIPFSVLHGTDDVFGARPLAAPGVSAERTLALAAGADRIVYGTYALVGGRLRAEASVEDAVSGKITRTASAAAAPGDVAGAATTLASRLAPTTRPFPVRDGGALRAYVEGLEQRDPATALRSFEQAVAAAPAFGQAWISALGAAVAARDGTAARRLLADARARAASLAPLDRARLELETTTLAGDIAGRRRSLSTLVRLDPADPGPWRALAALAQTAHDYPQSAAMLRGALARYPDDPALLNNAAYAEAYAGNLDAAVADLERYRRVRPRDPNALDSLGDVHLHLGKLPEAERYYLESWTRDSAFEDGGSGLKAAWARLMTGDVRGAGGIFQRYLDARRAAGDPVADYRRAEWLWLSGDRRAAVDALAAFATARETAAARELAARARANLALWYLELGDAPAARREAERAQALSGPASAGLAAVARFLTEPPASASEWAVRAERAFPSPGTSALKDFALANALLLAREFGAAAPLLHEIYGRWSPGGDPAIPVLTAWAYAASGRQADAAPLVARNPIPQAAGLNLFTGLWFPRLFFLRGEVLTGQGKRDDARRNYQLFVTLSGPSATIWGEEQRARSALGR